MYLLHTLNPCHLKKHPPPEGQPNFVGVRQHHYAIQPVFTPILFFLKIEDIGQEADNKMCPGGATCLPMLGNVLAPSGQARCPKMGENLTIWHSTKKQFQRLYF